METLRSSCALLLLLLLLSLDVASPGNSPPGLVCVNDFVSTVSCAWTGAAPPPPARCSITGQLRIWVRRKYVKTRPRIMSRSCRLEQHHNSPPGCSFAFENATFNMNSRVPSIRMECDGTAVEDLSDYEPEKHIKMNPPGVPVVTAAANHTWISWGPGGPWSEFTTSRFHAQIKKTDQPWEEAFDLFTEDPELKVQSQQFSGLCEVRVRVQPSVPPNEHWSNWSPTTSWLGATETPRTDVNNEVSEWVLDQTVLLCSLGVVFLVFLLLSLGYVRRRVFKKKPVPNPSKYFCTLQSLYEGNLKAWLNPAEAFFTAQPNEGISSVEVCDIKARPRSSVWASAPMLSGTDGHGVGSSSRSSSSSYTNIGYFLSSSSGGSAPAERGPARFTYPDDGGSGHSGVALSLRSSFGNTRGSESLEPEPQSPDSGFSFGQEDEADPRDTDGPEDRICPLLVFPLQHPHPPPPQSASPSHPSSGDAANGGSVCRSSSMSAQPCRSGYLTLKELHMTFSNKSI